MSRGTEMTNTPDEFIRFSILNLFWHMCVCSVLNIFECTGWLVSSDATCDTSRDEWDLDCRW